MEEQIRAKIASLEAQEQLILTALTKAANELVGPIRAQIAALSSFLPEPVATEMPTGESRDA